MFQVQILTPNSIEEQKKEKKKVFTAVWYYIRPEFRTYSCWEQLFCLIIQNRTLNGKSAEILLGGAEVFSGGTLNLDGGR